MTANATPNGKASTMTIIISENAKGQQRIGGKGRWTNPRNVSSAIHALITGARRSGAAVCILVNAQGGQESYLAEALGWSRGEDANRRARALRAQGRPIWRVLADQTVGDEITCI